MNKGKKYKIFSLVFEFNIIENKNIVEIPNDIPILW